MFEYTLPALIWLTFVSYGNTEKSPVELGMEMVAKSYQLVCRYESDYNPTCGGLQQKIKDQVLEMYKGSPEKMEKEFQIWSKKQALPLIPSPYRSACGKYLLDPQAEPLSDESEALEDQNQNYSWKAYSYCLVQTLKQQSNGLLERDAGTIKVGMEMVTKAYDMVCEYEIKYHARCRGQQKNIENQILHSDFFKDNPDRREDHFQSWSANYPLKSLPPSYKDACVKYLDDPTGKPPADEGHVLNDGGADYHFKNYAYCMLNELRKVSKGAMARDENALFFGMDMVTQAYDTVCKSEMKDEYPYSNCKIQQAHTTKNVKESDFFKENPSERWEYFGRWSMDHPMKALPPKYKDKCRHYLVDYEANFEVDKSAQLGDEGRDYPYKGYAHCILHVMG